MYMCSMPTDSIYLPTNATLTGATMQIENIKDIDEYYKKIEFVSVSAESDYTQKLTQFSETYNVLISPCYSLGGNEDVGLSGYFYVKLKQLSDSNLLSQMASQTHSQIISQHSFLPLWYTLCVSNQTQMNGLQAANYFYE